MLEPRTISLSRQRQRDLGALLNRALGVELRRDVRSTDERYRHAGSGQTVVEFTQRLLTCTDNHVVDVQYLLLTVDAQVQAVIVDFLVAATGHHVDAEVGERAAVNPSGGFAEPSADFGFGALVWMLG